MRFRHSIHSSIPRMAELNTVPEPDDSARPCGRVVLFFVDAGAWEVLDLKRDEMVVGRIFRRQKLYATEHREGEVFVDGFSLRSLDDARVYFEEYLFAIDLGVRDPWQEPDEML